MSATPAPTEERAAREPILEVEDLHVSYGAIIALRGISLRVGKGEVVALIGANGAGKTTTLRAVSGMRPDVATRGVGFPGSRGIPLGSAVSCHLAFDRLDWGPQPRRAPDHR